MIVTEPVVAGGHTPYAGTGYVLATAEEHGEWSTGWQPRAVVKDLLDHTLARTAPAGCPRPTRRPRRTA